MWSHLALVVVLGVSAQLVMAVAWSTEEGLGLFAALLAAVPAMGGWIYGTLPIAVGVSVALVQRVRRGGLRWLAIVGTLAMVAVDVGAPTGQLQIGQRLAVEGTEAFSDPTFSDFSRISAIRTSVALMAEGGGAARERLDRYPSQHPRFQASDAILKGTFMALPAVLVALVGVLLLWVDEQVVFRRAGARKIARLWIAWISAPGIFWIWAELAERSRASAMFGSGALTTILLPVAIIGPLALIAWRAIPFEKE